MTTSLVNFLSVRENLSNMGVLANLVNLGVLANFGELRLVLVDLGVLAWCFGLVFWRTSANIGGLVDLGVLAWSWLGGPGCLRSLGELLVTVLVNLSTPRRSSIDAKEGYVAVRLEHASEAYGGA